MIIIGCAPSCKECMARESILCEAIMCLGYYLHRDAMRVTVALDWSWGHATPSLSVPSTVGTKKGPETILQSSYEVPRVAEFKE